MVTPPQYAFRIAVMSIFLRHRADADREIHIGLKFRLSCSESSIPALAAACTVSQRLSVRDVFFNMVLSSLPSIVRDQVMRLVSGLGITLATSDATDKSSEERRAAAYAFRARIAEMMLAMCRVSLVPADVLLSIKSCRRSSVRRSYLGGFRTLDGLLHLS